MAGIVTPSQPHVVMGFKLKKFPHSPEVNAINTGLWKIHNIASKGSTFEACGFKDVMSGGITFNIGGTLTLSSVKQMCINYIVFTCKACNDHEVEVEEGLKNIVEKTTRKTVDAIIKL